MHDSQMYSSDPNLASDDSKEQDTNAAFVNRFKRRRAEDDYGKQLQDFKEEMKELFTSMFSDWKTEINSKLTTLQTGILELKSQTRDLQKSNVEIEKSLQSLDDHYYEINQKVDILEEESSEYKQKIETLEVKVEDLQRQLLSNTIEIRNVPCNGPETQENLLKLLLDTTKTLSIETTTSDVSEIRRLPGKPDTKKPIVVSFSSVLHKNKVLKAAKEFNLKNKTNKLNSNHISIAGPPTPIYVAEHLTQKARKLYFLARELNKDKLFKHCWTANGKVFLRKDDGTQLITITEEHQLKNLKSSSQ